MGLLSKRDFRQRQIRALEKINQTVKQKEEKIISKYLFNSNEWVQSKVVGITLSQVHEFSTDALIQEAKKINKTIVIPRTYNDDERTMEFVRLDADTILEPKVFGILEPTNGIVYESDQIDLMLVPGVAFESRDGFRVGFGAGYYDRYLANFKGITMALAFEEQLFKLPEWKVNDFDVPIKIICSTGGLQYATD
ncbi:5-formyltetrahydrofolate cyclo-ligase [Pediococcus claussenii ATCC BAA-344]|uniref:5-formyltetrahydrofolate cyclo-ligase n=1 Tax=Pediococcus claussenii (strain ATCC BAA-344 / DSM 14800 / JCM 18046 / KCTC 3811 / LMG 21948 / P06) TaxID=701521 RepID=G8PDN2_PEDCP|nr:5-formyltetrahydrofolate cyclo-ligase [Pediococcus claussenii ATCC BAA-344]ANZ70714.1 hypothetical protein AYR58_00545 [Pediococcus claussenii]KRN19010.1 hypothetical protein IV79_GL001672 [Pediococcus claussenii]